MDAINSSLEELAGTVSSENEEATAELLYLKALFGISAQCMRWIVS